MAKESSYFYEAERKNIVLSHDDFAQEEVVDDLAEISELEDFLLTKDCWEAAIINKRTHNEIDTRIANDIFTECHLKFRTTIDVVRLFDVITRFYNFSSKNFYEKLGHKYRTMLLNDLQRKISINISNDTEIDDKKIQKSFVDLLQKFK